jgi:aminoglycoside phosphotransferase (APT) family kinase protein
LVNHHQYRYWITPLSQRVPRFAARVGGTVSLLTPPAEKPAIMERAGPSARRVPPGLAALAGQFPGLRVDGMLSHNGKSLLAAGHAGDQPVIIKVLPEHDPSWRHRQRHEITVYQIFAEHPPPVRVPGLVHTDGQRIVVMERLEGTTLGTGRYPQALTGREVEAAAALVGQLHDWQPLPGGFRPVFAYYERIARYHATGYFTEDDRRLLERLLARCGQPVQLNHGDPLPGNMLRLPGGEWALLDWEFTGLFLPGFDLAMLSVLLTGTPGAAEFIDDLAYRAGYEDAYLVNLAVVLSRERRIHLTLPEDHPLRVARLPAIDDAWARARERFRSAAGRRLFAGADRWTKTPSTGHNAVEVVEPAAIPAGSVRLSRFAGIAASSSRPAGVQIGLAQPVPVHLGAQPGQQAAAGNRGR